MNPVSLPELSLQVRLICVAETAVARRLLGAAGTVGAASVVALAVLESDDGPTPLVARTR